MFNNLTIRERLRLFPIFAVIMTAGAGIFIFMSKSTGTDTFIAETLIIAGGLAFIALSSAVSKTILNSVENLTHGFEAITRTNDTGIRLEISGNDEICEAARHFNAYMERLDAVAHKDQEAIADIANVAKLMAVGFVSVRIKAQAGSPALQQTINGFNTALAEMEKADRKSVV